MNRKASARFGSSRNLARVDARSVVVAAMAAVRTNLAAKERAARKATDNT
jgi:hypothetical protein